LPSPRMRPRAARSRKMLVASGASSDAKSSYASGVRPYGRWKRLEEPAGASYGSAPSARAGRRTARPRRG
jgi:hypothetical protein